jgi:hypothetical protein
VIERRREPRVQSDISVQVWGTNAQGKQFCQPAIATNVSQSGALLSGIEYGMRSGDLVGVAYRGTQARFRIIWGRESGGCEKIRIAVQKLAGDPCPGEDLLPR